jgi:hypothetical protein
MITTDLKIEVTDLVAYQADIYDPSHFATVPGVTVPITPRNFFVVTLIGDIKKVNEQDASGTYVGYNRALNASPNAVNGGAKADITRIAMREHIFEILNHHGAAIGSIMSSGFSGGVAPGLPGDGGNWAITGGTGAYLGARGQAAGIIGGPRPASIKEDPGHRIGHGNPDTFLLRVIPMNPPQIMATPLGPSVFHMNHIPVTVFTPAKQNQHISVFATGLGLTHPDVDLTQPFPVQPDSKVNSPLAMTVNGMNADILHAVGVPGTVGAYHVTFKMPAGVPPGLVPLQLTAAWIASPPVSIWAE